jgi:site-specific recombinase XerD
MTFSQYLKEKNYSEATISRYQIYINRFLTWLNHEDLHPETFTYTELLDFMRYSQSQGVTKRTVHNILCIVRHYCNYLACEGK